MRASLILMFGIIFLFFILLLRHLLLSLSDLLVDDVQLLLGYLAAWRLRLRFGLTYFHFIEFFLSLQLVSTNYEIEDS